MSETTEVLQSLSQRLAEHITEQFCHQMTDQQAEATQRIAEFLVDPRSDQAFVLRGYAGTGKTSLVGAVVKTMRALERDVVLLAPTGRAAKVFSASAEQDAYTIHKVIYRQRTFDGEDTLFDRGWNRHKGTLFVVDEASMIATHGGGSRFGTGNLLDDLVHFVFEAQGCRLMLVGDTAQLPPVGETESPALSSKRLRQDYALNVREADLTTVVRQAERSAVLRNATYLRSLVCQGEFKIPTVEARPYDGYEVEGQEVCTLPGNELIEALISSYNKYGTQDTIVVTRSNKRANIYNNGIRARIFDREDVLTRGDIVMAVKNNYYWVETVRNELQAMRNTALARQGMTQAPGLATNALPQGTDTSDDEGQDTLPMSFIANGDTAEVIRYRNVHEQYGFTFADVTLRFPDYDDYELEVRVLLDTLQSESPSLTAEEQNRLYESVLEDYAHIPLKRERMKAIRRDPYYNALQIKYAYAVTCHKAQGGQWHEVYVDQGYLTDDMADLSYFRWLYTAFTRTTDNLYLVNWPKQGT